MQRFHINISVTDLKQSIEFYNTLFGVEPTVVKDDYAKWMLEDPRINFSMAVAKERGGVNHVGLQADTMEELEAIQSRLEKAREKTFEQPDVECCYANSSKTWVRDPDDVTWETFVTHGEITHYGDGLGPDDALSGERCCM